MLFFALNGSGILGRAVADAGGFPVAVHEERDFEGGEHKTRPLVSVRGEDVYVLHSLHGIDGASANDKLCRLLFFIAACKENGAARVTAVVPYLAYSRKDRQTKPRDPVTTRYVASLFEAVGADMVVTLDVHTPMAFQNAYRCRTLHLETRKVFAAALGERAPNAGLCVMSPDGGGVKRAELFRETLEAMTGVSVDFAFMEKRRSAGIVSGSLFAGDVQAKHVIIVDDMIVGGGTMIRAAEACRERGAARVDAVATHALFGKGFATGLKDGPIDRLFVSDSTAPPAVPEGSPLAGLEVVTVAPLIAEAIRRLAFGGSIDELLEG